MIISLALALTLVLLIVFRPTLKVTITRVDKDDTSKDGMRFRIPEWMGKLLFR